MEPAKRRCHCRRTAKGALSHQALASEIAHFEMWERLTITAMRSEIFRIDLSERSSRNFDLYASLSHWNRHASQSRMGRMQAIPTAICSIISQSEAFNNLSLTASELWRLARWTRRDFEQWFLVKMQLRPRCAQYVLCRKCSNWQDLFIHISGRASFKNDSSRLA